MKEIEVKARLRDKKKLLKKLKSIGCVFDKKVTQNDIVYAERVGSLKSFLSNKIFLRIRLKNKSKVIFTVKKPIASWLNKTEYETEVSSKEEMQQAILLMGYKEAVRVSKNRVVAHYKDYEICVDDIHGLGSFIEIEKLSKNGDPKKIQKQLYIFLESLGIKKDDSVNPGYDILMLQKDKWTYLKNIVCHVKAG